MLNSKHVATPPAGNLIVIENEDVPGIIGAVGTVFGNHKINIDQMTWGAKPGDKLAMTIINVDQGVTDELVKELQGLPRIKSVEVISL